MSVHRREGVLQDFFRVGKVLQVDFTVTIDKNHGCSEKSKNPPKNTGFQKSDISGVFWIFLLSGITD